jgi:hypothetical protein
MDPHWSTKYSTMEYGASIVIALMAVIVLAAGVVGIYHQMHH